jgi:hypothetical protein
MSHESRVTVDIDDHGPNWQLRAVRAYHGLVRAADSVETRVSSSGSGIHLIGWFDERLSADEKERLRRTLGDDSKRLELDEMRARHGHATNVLWTEKNGTDGVDTDFDNVYDALDHIRVTA